MDGWTCRLRMDGVMGSGTEEEGWREGGLDGMASEEVDGR